MEIDFKKLMLDKSDEDLQEYIENREKYMQETIEAVIFEMQRRGRIFSLDEIERFKLEIDLKRKANESELMNTFRIPQLNIKISKKLFILPFALVLIGLILRQMEITGNLFFTFFGFSTFFIWSIIQTIQVLFNAKSKLFDLMIPAMISIMSVILFLKYMNYNIVDWIGLILIPIFIIIGFLELIKRQSKGLMQYGAVIFYLILTLPMFGVNLYIKPRQYISSEYYDRYGLTTKVPTKLPYQLKYKETEELYFKGLDLNESEKYFEAIDNFRKALVYEPNHPSLLIGLSNSYAEINELEKAVSLLDSAIMIDKYCITCYNNRGLLYYKLNNLSKAKQNLLLAIEIDTTFIAAYSNLALVYKAEEKSDSICFTLNKISKYSHNEIIDPNLDRMKRKYCK